MNTTTSLPQPHNQQTPPQTNDTRHSGPVKAIDISDCITMVDVALEHLRQQRGKKKTNKHDKPIFPQGVDVSLTQALMVSRAHLVDYRKQVDHEVRTKHEINQDSSINTIKLMNGISPFATLEGETLQEPQEPIDKLKAVVSLLMGNQDEKTNEFMINIDHVTWAIILIWDLAEEIEKRANKYQEHCFDLFREVENRLEKYYLVRRDLAKRVAKGTVHEVSP